VPSLAVVASLAGAGGMGDKQLAALEKLVRLLPNDDGFLEKYCQMLLERKRDDEARPFIARFRKLAPNSHLAATYEGILIFRADTTPQGSQKAIALFQEALRLEPNALFPRLYLGKLYLRLHQPELALRALEDAARKMPRKMDLQFELANAYTQAKQPEKATLARQHFEALRRDNDKMHSLMKRCAVDTKNFALFKETGLFCLSIDSFLNARVYLDHAEKLQPGDPEVKAAWQTLLKKEEKRQELVDKLAELRRAQAPQKEAGKP
jgi:predicted Zn-dependent protease